jgi:hypothetical protein
MKLTNRQNKKQGLTRFDIPLFRSAAPRPVTNQKWSRQNEAFFHTSRAPIPENRRSNQTSA